MLEFYQTVLGVDVWREINTKSGNLVYSFFYNGKPYEYSSVFDATKSIQGLINLAKGRARVKGS